MILKLTKIEAEKLYKELDLLLQLDLTPSTKRAIKNIFRKLGKHFAKAV